MRANPLRVVVRRESAADRDAIRSLTARAFSGLSLSDGTEPLVIDALREANALVVSLVAVRGQQIVGHVAFSDVGPPEQCGWFALGPVSVDPPYQRRGVGSRLIEAGLQALRERGAKGCVLVGDHRYYHRFGFAPAPALAPSGVPPQHFQVVRFGDSLPDAPVAFHPGFSVRPDRRRPDGVNDASTAIRPFQDRDEAPVIDVWHRSGRAAYGFLPTWQTLTRERAGEIFRDVIRPRCSIWVGTRHEQVVAFLAMTGSYIDRMFVDPAEWRRGWGTRFVLLAKTLHPSGLELHTHQENHAARRLYEKHGFKAVKLDVSPPPESAPDIEYHWRPDGMSERG